jgi:hypothetical protein
MNSRKREEGSEKTRKEKRQTREKLCEIEDKQKRRGKLI